MAILGDYCIFMFVGRVISGYTQACTSQEKYIVTFKTSLLPAEEKNVYTNLPCSESVMTLLEVKSLQPAILHIRTIRKSLHFANLHINASRTMDHND